jgi:hypothetical protein
MMMARCVSPLALFLAFCITAIPAVAEERERDWHFQVSPYLWLASLEGDIATLSGLPKVDVDASFDDILDNLDFAVMLAAEARYRRLGALVDLAYLELSVDEGTPGPFFSEVDLSTDTFFATIAGFYRVVDEDRGGLDLLAGARVWNVDTVLEFKPGLLQGRRTSDDEAWIDPVLGARTSFRLFGPLFASAGGDIGGFGAASDFTWQAIGTLDLVPWDWLAIRAGYRHLDVDYDHGGFVWDVAMSGPIIGASLRF